MNLDRTLRWLNEKVGHQSCAQWPTGSSHGDATAFHLRTIDEAAGFCAAFPMFELADGTARERG